MTQRYVHGYAAQENNRLQDQARTLESLLHADTGYPPGAAVLEAGCGVGAQTVPLARNSPGARITAIDIDAASLEQTRARLDAQGIDHVRVTQADVRALPFADESFDHAFVCFVLEHLREPEAALLELKRVLRPGGTITVIEGDHGSAYFHPRNEAAAAAIDCQVELQHRAGGDARIGRRLYPLLSAAGYGDARVSPRMVYVDGSKPEWADGFIRKTFTAMIAGVREPAIAARLIDPDRFDAGIAALLRSGEADGTFCYTFFKAKGWVPQGNRASRSTSSA